jgi:uncharacterized membrane protein
VGGSGQDSGQLRPAGSMLTGVRVASKPAFAVVVGTVAFLAQDLFQRITGVQLTTDEAAGIVTVFSWLAYWLVPVSMQDAGTPVVTVVPPAPPTPGAPAA